MIAGHRDLREPAEWLDSGLVVWHPVAGGSAGAVASGFLDGAVGCASDSSSRFFESMSDIWISRYPILTGAQEFLLIRISVFLQNLG